MSALIGKTLYENKRDPTMHGSQVNNNNVLDGVNVMPMKSQTTHNGSQFSMMRRIFQKTPKINPLNNTTKRGKNTLYQDHSQYLERRKARAMGKPIYKDTSHSFNSNNSYDTRNAKRRMRKSGAAVPPKVALRAYMNQCHTNDNTNVLETYEETKEVETEIQETKIEDNVTENVETYLTDQTNTISEVTNTVAEESSSVDPASINTNFVNFNYTDSEISDDVTFVKSILSNILIESNEVQNYNINITVTTMDSGVLGGAIWETGDVYLNVDNYGNTVYLNDQEVGMNTLVLLHETLHILGVVGLTNAGRDYISTDISFSYVGENAVREYKELLNTNNYDTSNMIYDIIPLEDDFGASTQTYHFEEGYDEYVVNGITYYREEQRYYNDIYYPIIANEIMTGFLQTGTSVEGKSNYLTTMTLGVLQDNGFVVNYDSTHVSNTGSYLANDIEESDSLSISKNNISIA